MMQHKMIKRGVAILLVLCMALTLFPTSALAADPAETESRTEPDTAPAEDASVQRGDYTPPAEPEGAPAQTEPAEEDPAPAETEPAEAESAGTEPAETEPTEAEAAQPQRSVPEPQSAGNAANEGRSSADQQVLTVDGKDFILIGTKQQLQALDYYPQSAAVGDANSDQIMESRRYDVTGPIWRVHYTRPVTYGIGSTVIGIGDWEKGEAELVYPGDNNLTGEYANYTLYGENDSIMEGNGAGHKLGDTEIVTTVSYFGTKSVDEWRYCTGTMTEPNEDVTEYDYGKYSPRNNYVIFRDIDLNSENWTPLMFYGLMYGVKGSELTDTTLAAAVQKMMNSQDAQDYAELVQPAIRNVSVNTASETRYANESQDKSVLLPDKYVGVGFFASVTSARPGSDSGLAHAKAEVRNLRLEDVNVTNGYSSIFINETLVSWLTTNLGSGVGYLLDFLLRILTGKTGTDFANSVRDLLTARAKDPTNFATGSFAGRIYGDVLIENCDVLRATVNSAKSYVGGFVGYSTGAEQYDLVSESLGSLLKLLKTILNLIPGLGLGDLISIVQNVLPLNTLVPVNYLNPHVEDCDLSELSGSLGPVDLTWNFPKNSVDGLVNDTVPAQCNGGFIGCKLATVMIHCGVHDSEYTVYAKQYGGGFAGLARDAVIQELLTDLGVNLGIMKSLLNRLMDSGIDLQSIQVRCSITGSTVSVIGEDCLGGFNGAMTNAYCINNEMRSQGKTLTVQGSGNCVGGFAGIATLGWAMSLGQGEANGNTSLLSTLKNVVTSLTGSYGTELLSLLGVGQSEILGLQFDYSRTAQEGEGAGVTGYDYVGGLVGKADALIMTGTTAANLSRMTYFQHGDLTAWDVFPDMPRTGSYTVTYHDMDGSITTQTVTAAENYSITLPTHADNGAYKFVGWSHSHYDHSIGEPDDLFPANTPYLITRDITFNAVYSIEGETVWELLTGSPANWETEHNSYVLSYGRDAESMRVLAGLNDDASYESANSGGANSVAQIRNGDDSVFVMTSGILISNVPNLYLFTADQVASTKDYYFKNVEKNTYLRCDLQGTTHRLEASSNALMAGTQWHPSVTANLNVLFENDLSTTSKPYITYHTDGYFLMGSAENANANKLYIWGETKLPMRYTTVTAGAEIPQENDSVSLDQDSIGEYAKIHVKGLELVNGHKYVGGIAGLAGTANVGGLLNDTIGVGDFKKFECSDIESIGGTELTEGSSEYGLKVYGHVADKSQDSGAGFYVGGGVGMAIGGDLFRIRLERLAEIDAVNCVGGFGGCVGPGDLISTDGLNVQLLGLSLLSANKLLSVGSGVLTDARTVRVKGVPAGFTVRATGENANGSQVVYTAGGFYGRANSSSVQEGRVENLLSVRANNTDGRAGGFVGVSEVGGLASVDSPEGTEIKSLLSAGKLLEAVGYLIPDFTLVDTNFVDGGFVEAAWAGGFAADFQSGTVDNSGKDSGDWYAVYNIDRVSGTRYAGGFGAKLYSGALADVGGGISILGGISNLSIGVSDFLSLVQAYVPTVTHAGVHSLSTATDPNNPGFTVECKGYDANDKTTGAAGGFVGYASGAQISYSDVLQLRHTLVTEPEELEGKDGASYFSSRSSYAVTGTRYGGGYAGFLDIGSSASLGGGLSALHENLNLNSLLSALNVVISTVEHSTVTGGPGGFAVKASVCVGDGQSGGGESATEPNVITVYVVDNTPTETLWAYIFNSQTDSHDGRQWPGHELQSEGEDENGNKYYSFTVDRSLYNRVIFCDGTDQYKTQDDQCLHLDDSYTLSKLEKGILTVSNNSGGYPWKVEVEDDIRTIAGASGSCRGSYKHYVSVRGKEEYVENVTNESASHSFAPAVQTAATSTHTYTCTRCGYQQSEACSYYNGMCTECGGSLPGALPEGRSGGFVGWMKGAHIQDSHVDTFSHIIGQIAAGGYAGEIEPGNVADVAGGISVLQGAVEVDQLLSVARDFVPSIRNSTTAAIPCGGVVRADALSDGEVQRGMAGGYVGHNLGGQIWGNNRSAWKDENEVVNNTSTYRGKTSECAAIRILSVYGAEYAGGFTGLMDAGSTAGTGNVSLLFDLVKLNGLLDALKISYPTEENTAVYGPLEGMNPGLWNAWVQYVGVYGGYGMGMEEVPLSISEQDFADMMKQYIYGFHVAAGRDSYQNLSLTAPGGCAGGYVGAMRSGTITNGQANDVKQVRAMRNAGGFAGEMKTGSVANLGQASVLGLDLNLSQLLEGAVQVFVPVVKTSSVRGYQNGMSVLAFGDSANGSGCAGGFAGVARGAQIWGDADDSLNADAGCNVSNLKKVQGTRHVGGYIGILSSGTSAEVGTDVSEGPLQDLLDAVIKSGSDQASSLLSAVNATVSTVRNATVDVADREWGFTVGGWTEQVTENGESFAVEHLPLTAGGFIGTMEGAIIGEKESVEPGIKVCFLRGVRAQYYAGGFVGKASMDGAASVADSKANVLGLIDLGQVSALDIFRPYIFKTQVSGVREGFTVETFASEPEGVMASRRYSGCAGGFAGALLSGTAEDSGVIGLSSVKAPNYGGGFVGFTGKSGAVDVDDVSSSGLLGKLLSLQAGIGDIVGSTMEADRVSGVSRGFTVESASGRQPIAGGFVGYGDLAQIEDCHADALKYVVSDEVAGGFIGQTSLAYLVEAQVGGELTDLLVSVVNALVNQILNVDDLAQLNLAQITILGQTVNLLTDGDLVYVDLLGLKIGVGFSDVKDGDNQVSVRIGDSSVTLNLNGDTVVADDDSFSNITVQLFRSNHTNVKNSSVTGIDLGFDVFGGGASQEEPADSAKGSAGGFVGLNEESILQNCEVKACDVIRGTADLTGPFSGSTVASSVYENYNISHLEGSGNSYEKDGAVKQSYNPDNRYNGLEEPKNLVRNEDDAVEKIILRKDTALKPNVQAMTPETAEMQNPCLPTVDVTMHKVWDDMDGSLGLRASSEAQASVTFTLWQVVNGDFQNPVKLDDCVLSAEDANPFTDNVWTKVIRGLPATNGSYDGLHPGDDGFERYSYYVTETVGSETFFYLSGTAYADADPTNKLSFDGSKNSGYVAKIVNQAILDQTVVVDYGLPVSISLVDYLRQSYGYPVEGLELAGVLPVSDLTKVSGYGAENAGDSLLSERLGVTAVDGTPTPVVPDATQSSYRYGSFEVPAKAEGESQVTRLRYVPGSMQLDKSLQIAAALRIPNGGCYYTKVTVVPATNIYFEENFIDFTPLAEAGQDADESVGWINTGSKQSGEQDEDRPGPDLMDSNNLYGWDSKYANNSTYSLGQSMMVHVDNSFGKADKPWPTATFTFTGVGFDLLALTGSESGYMMVKVYDGDEVREDKLLTTWAVDSYYGCQRVLDEDAPWIRHEFIWSETDKRWHVIRSAYTKTPPAVGSMDPVKPKLEVRDAFPKKTDVDHRSFVVYRENYVWRTNESSVNLYQVPVITSLDAVIRDPQTGASVLMKDRYGTYTVQITAKYARFFDHNLGMDGDLSGYDLYVDGVRIYGPAAADQNLDTLYYLKDHEGWPQYVELRDLLLAQQELSPISEDADAPFQTGAVLIDGLGATEDSDVFRQYGPNNEIYLEKGQAIAFALKKGASAAVDRVHLSLKCGWISEGYEPGPNVSIYRIPTQGDPAVMQLPPIASTAEGYYDISDAVAWNANGISDTVVIRNTSDQDVVISLRNLKITYTGAVADSADLVTVVTSRTQVEQAVTAFDDAQILPLIEDGGVIDFASVSVKNGFDLHFFVEESKFAQMLNPAMVFQGPSGSFTAQDYESYNIDGKRYRVYTYPNIAAKQLSETVSARIFYGKADGEHVSEDFPYSVKQFAMDSLEQTEDAELRTMLVDLLNYGTEAQRYFEYNTNALANGSLTAAQQSWATQTDPVLNNCTQTLPLEDATASIPGAYLSLENRVVVNYYLDLSGCKLAPKDLALSVSWEEGGQVKTVLLDGAWFQSVTLNGKNLCLASLDVLNATQMRTELHAVIVRKSDAAAVSAGLNYSIESYAASKTAPAETSADPGTGSAGENETAPDDEALKNLLFAMMKFGDSAAAYYAQNEGDNG